MNQVAKIDDRRSVLVDISMRYGMEPQAFEATVRATCMPSGKEQVSREQFAAFLLVAKEYDLNPLTREIYAFPGKGGGIQPIVSIDGWMSMINKHPAFDGMQFNDILEGGKLTAVECRMFRKDRSHPITVIEYMSECKRTTEPWQKWPARMLRHKAAIQCARYAFGFSGIVDPDEADRLQDAPPSTGLAARLAATPRASEGFNAVADQIIEAEIVDPQTGEITETSEPNSVDTGGSQDGEGSEPETAPEPSPETQTSDDPVALVTELKAALNKGFADGEFGVAGDIDKAVAPFAERLNASTKEARAEARQAVTRMKETIAEANKY